LREIDLDIVVTVDIIIIIIIILYYANRQYRKNIKKAHIKSNKSVSRNSHTSYTYTFSTQHFPPVSF